jgi:CarD family transcriptional regulator
MGFNVGDRVVHPQHGVGDVVKLERREFEPGMMRQYYEVSVSSGSTIWVPFDPPSFGLRTLAARSEINRCRQILAARPSPLGEDSRSRQADLTNRLRQGTIRTQCEVVRDLYAFGEHKSLYGSIAGFFRQTQQVLCQEWAIVEGVTPAEAMQEVTALLEKSRRTVNKAKA